eukprot:655622-Prorocentrum_minimum.AAC.2
MAPSPFPLSRTSTGAFQAVLCAVPASASLFISLVKPMKFHVTFSNQLPVPSMPAGWLSPKLRGQTAEAVGPQGMV